MTRLRWMLGLMAGCLLLVQAQAALFGRHRLEQINQQLCGQLVDYTHNHGADNRIWSDALCQKRDLYVYLPPHYDPNRLYAFAIYLHGASQDEQAFLDLVTSFDKAIATGQIPPVILAAPDGSIQGRPTLFNSASFFANTHAGNFEDWLIQDVYNFMMLHYPLRQDREGHALVGASMGGAAAFAHAMKYKDRFKMAVGFHPALNMRWVDCHCKYRAPFDPCCWGWRTDLNPHEALGRTKGVAIRFKYLLDPLVGRGPDAIDRIAEFNPIELLDMCDIRPGDLDFFIAYGGKDELNIAAQVESFLYRAHERGLEVGVAYDPNGKHDLATGRKLFPQVIDWVAPRMAAYGW